MNRTDVDQNTPYAIRVNGVVTEGYVLGFTWSVKGEYLEGRATRSGAMLTLTRVPGSPNSTSVTTAREYTETRYRAMLAYSPLFGSDETLDKAMLPADGWTATTVPNADVLMSWDDYSVFLDNLELEAVDRRKQYRKLRTLLRKQVVRRDAATSLSQPLPALVGIEKITPKAVAKKAKLAQVQHAENIAEAKRAIEEGAVMNYQRAVRTAEAYLIEHFNAEGEDATMSAHQLVLDVSSIVIDEPRLLKARQQTIEVSATKKALEDRWRTGSDGNGYDWLGHEDVAPEHVIDVLVGTMIDRGWRPTA
jgi:hypothetical protein